MNLDTLKSTAMQMVASGKGIIAADESAPTCKKRFDAVGVDCTEETRRAYRTMMFETPGIEEYISGVILYDETIRQKGSDPPRLAEASLGEAGGTPVSELLAKKGILPGIKVDAGAKDMALHEGEKITEGLDGLRERLAEYKAMGARFAKWRAVITIDGDTLPSEACIFSNAHALARYSALCQEADIVPMVEPEVIIDGSHSIERCFEVTEQTLEEVFEELQHQNVALEGVILKASMVIAGKKASKQSGVDEVADQTLRVLNATVPKELAGVVFLSGGQGDEQATAHLNRMNQSGKQPWPLTFSYSRAIQNPVLKIWAANPKENITKAQQALLFRSKMNSLASQGKYSDEMEKARPYDVSASTAKV